MNEGRKEARRSQRLFWLAGIAITLAVHSVGLWLFRVGESEVPPPRADYSFVSMPPPADGHDGLLREWAYLFDSSPLFFPTGWNSAFLPTAEALSRKPADLFDPYPARLSYGERDFGLGAIVSARSDSLPESLQTFGDRAHQAFGLEEVKQPKAAARWAMLEVIDVATGEVILERAVSGEGAPAGGERLWSPAAFWVQVEAAGTLGEPVLARGSGDESIDAHLRQAVVELFQETLPPPGYYRVVAGP